MKVGCIGLGDIAQKAYLPVLGVQPGVELHLQTRTPATLARVADSLHLPAERRHTDLDSLLARGSTPRSCTRRPSYTRRS